MDEQKQQLIDRLHQAQNILVTVSASPSVDQLAAAIGVTLALNKLDKHGTAVFSGQIPSTIEFLKPEETLEKDTNSLRDFIIALDKTKADKLRYKVEDDVVRIFITPYHTSLSEKDLDFSQGDFNVDVVLALGVSDQQDLDTAITAHGRILHDATIASVSNTGQGSLGTINWVSPQASSLSEMMLGLVDGLDKKVMDGQIATALLTGIVASTDRFRNAKTSPATMTISSELMAAGANQQLIATELETSPEVSQATPNIPSTDAVPQTRPDPGTLEIEHHEDHDEPEAAETPEPPEAPLPQFQVDEDGHMANSAPGEFPKISQVRGGGDGSAFLEQNELGHADSDRPRFMGDGPVANSGSEDIDVPSEELTLPAVNSPIMSHDIPGFEPAAPEQSAANPWSPPVIHPTPAAPPVVVPLPPQPPVFTPEATLSDIEKSVASPHIANQFSPQTNPFDTPTPSAPTGKVDDARNAVEAAYNGAGLTQPVIEPIVALNAQPLGPDLHTPVAQPKMPVTNTGFSEPSPGNSPADQSLDMPLPSNPFGPGQQASPFTPPSFAPQAPPTVSPSAFPGQAQSNGQVPPPPVPPPMLPPMP